MNPTIPQSAVPGPQLIAPWRERWFPNHEWGLLIVLAIECGVFSLAGNNFLSAGNAFEVIRLAVELGLLALALTPIIITGGIDLSVGSMMGLSAVVLGSLWRDLQLPLPVAVAVALTIGALGGGDGTVFTQTGDSGCRRTWYPALLR